MTRQTLRLTLECDNRCVFCAQRGLDSGEALLYPQIEDRLRALREQGDALTLTGGEPTLAPRLLEIIKAARALGFRRVGLQSNGRGLADASIVGELAAAGLTDAHLSIHGPRAEVHEYHTGAPGSFKAIVDATRALARHEVAVVATTVLTRSNYRVLAAMPGLLRQWRVSAWLIRIVRGAGAAAAHEDRIVPRLAMAVPRALHAVELARRQGLAAWIEGAPLCLLGPYIRHGLRGDGLQAFPPRCDACELRSRCPGFDARYLHRFRGDEAAPRTVPEALRRALPGLKSSSGLLEMFVGIGELAPAGPPASAAPTRHALPVVNT